jgi:hypothetical protein
LHFAAIGLIGSIGAARPEPTLIPRDRRAEITMGQTIGFGEIEGSERDIGFRVKQVLHRTLEAKRSGRSRRYLHQAYG